MQVTELVATNAQKTVGYSIHFHPNEPWNICSAHLEHIKELHSKKLTAQKFPPSIIPCQIPNCHNKASVEITPKIYFVAVLLVNEI